MGKAHEAGPDNFWQTKTGKLTQGFLSGSGVVLALVPNMPLINIKTYIQNQPGHTTILNATRALYGQGGITRFYNGLTAYGTRVVLLFCAGNTAMAGVAEVVKPWDIPVMFKVATIGVMTSCVEVSSTVGFEAREITRTKRLPVPEGFWQKWCYVGGIVTQIAPLAVARNSFLWTTTGGVNTYSKAHGLSPSEQTTLSLPCGFLSGFLSTPLDYGLTNAAGTEKNGVKVIADTIKNGGVKRVFKGAVPRAMRMAFSVGSVGFSLAMTRKYIEGGHTERLEEERIQPKMRNKE